MTTISLELRLILCGVMVAIGLFGLFFPRKFSFKMMYAKHSNEQPIEGVLIIRRIIATLFLLVGTFNLISNIM
jgi:hypothetical protein